VRSRLAFHKEEDQLKKRHGFDREDSMSDVDDITEGEHRRSATNARERTEIEAATRAGQELLKNSHGGERTPAERSFFKRCLGFANLLYLGLTVLVIADSAYLNRFWTQFECFLSMRDIVPTGFGNVPKGRRRVHWAVTGVDDKNPERIIDPLVARWAVTGTDEALRNLAQDDVEVTNGKDKTLQIEKLVNLQRSIGRLWAMVFGKTTFEAILLDISESNPVWGDGRVYLDVSPPEFSAKGLFALLGLETSLLRTQFNQGFDAILNEIRSFGTTPEGQKIACQGVPVAAEPVVKSDFVMFGMKGSRLKADPWLKSKTDTRSNFKVAQSSQKWSDQEWLDYILQPASELVVSGTMYARDRGHDKWTLHDFAAHPDARNAGLELAHILALRLYTSGAFSSINNPLRAGCSSANPYPFPTLMVYLSEALKLLRTSELRNNRQTMGGRRLYRGLRNIAVPENFLEYGGTERAPMSSSSDRDVALKFAFSEDAVSSLLLVIEADNFMCCGADVNFVSVFPVEAEFLYPPGMFLFPKSDVQKEEVRVPGTEQMKVVDVLEVRVYFPT